MAQLVARLNGIEKVRGSNPLSSTSVKYLEALETLVFQGFFFSRSCDVPTFCPCSPICHYWAYRYGCVAVLVFIPCVYWG